MNNFKKSQIYLQEGVRSSKGALQRSLGWPESRRGFPQGKELK